MCGQAGIHRRTSRPVARLGALANELLLAIEPRGRHATGMLAVLDTGLVQLQRDTVPALRFVKQRKRISDQARTVLLHTRYATVGRKDDVRNAHPHAAGTIAATHNGTIWNADEVFRAFSLPRRATVDSEVIPALVNHAGWDQIDQALTLLEGDAAIALVNTDRPDEVVLARVHGTPLCFTVTKDAVVWASTPAALRDAWRRAYGKALRTKVTVLAEGEIARINGTVKVAAIEGWKPRRSHWYRPEPKRQPKAKRQPKKAKRRSPQMTLADLTWAFDGALERDDPLVDALVGQGWRRSEAEAYGTWADVEYDTSGMSPATRAFYELN